MTILWKTAGLAVRTAMGCLTFYKMTRSNSFREVKTIRESIQKFRSKFEKEHLDALKAPEEPIKGQTTSEDNRIDTDPGKKNGCVCRGKPSGGASAESLKGSCF